jgi:Xaa-Pro aminopeptidase
LTNGVILGETLVIKRRGMPPVLLAKPIEREVAQETGLAVILDTRYDFVGLLKQHQGDLIPATVAYYHRIFEDLGIRGRVGFYGMDDRGHAYALLQALAKGLPEITIVSDLGVNLLTLARATKSAEEAARIREVGRRTIDIVRQTVAFLQTHTAGKDEILRKPEGEILTVGDVHLYIRRLIALAGLEDPEGFMFSTGRDAGVPHNKGTLSNPVAAWGEYIIFDIYPCEAGGGYFFDMTRTFCLGYAPDAVKHIYGHSRLSGSHHGTSRNRPGDTSLSTDDLRVLPSTRPRDHCGDSSALEGYIHSLGHGVGLDVHEAPTFSDTPNNKACLQPGHVFTLEPGLYYPDQGMGCRLEDVMWIDEAGSIHNLTDYPYDLVIPIPKA